MNHGFGPLALLDGDIVSNALGRGEHWDTHVYDALAPYLDGDVIDVGANVGALTLRFAQSAPRVIAFEPNPNMYQCLISNIATLHLENVVAIPEGVYSYETTIYPDITGFPPSSWTWLRGIAGGRFHVKAGPGFWTDMGRRVSAIKVDVQGADLHALMGLEGVIVRDHPRMVIEFDKDLAQMHGHTWDDYVSWLNGRRYLISKITSENDDFFCEPS